MFHDHRNADDQGTATVRTAGAIHRRDPLTEAGRDPGASGHSLERGRDGVTSPLEQGQSVGPTDDEAIGLLAQAR